MDDRAKHVLVVEDDPASRAALRALLELSGHRVEEAENGTSAIAMVVAARPDVILLDVGLPDIDGYEVAARIRRTAGGDGPFVVALTGYDRDDDRARAQDAGCDAYLLKPVEPDALAKLLHQSGRNGHRIV